MTTDFWTRERHEVLLNPRWPSPDLEVLRGHAETLLDRQAEAPSLVLASSGTTAGSWREVKLILIRKKAFLVAASSVAEHLKLDGKDVLLRSLPAFHVGGLSIAARAYVSGARWIESTADSWRAEDLLLQGERESVSVISLVPTQLFDFVRMQYKPWPGLRHVVMGGAALDPELERRARALGWPLLATYGMTETSAFFASRSRTDEEGFTVLPHARVKISPAGRVCIHSQALADGFGRIRSAQLEWTPLVDSGGWFESEDRGDYQNSRLILHGRGEDVVKVGGEMVNVNSLRNLLEEEGRALGLNPIHFHLRVEADARRGHEVTLYHEAGVPADELSRRFARRVLPFERIQRIVEVDQIPRTELGKVLEARLSGRFHG